MITAKDKQNKLNEESRKRREQELDRFQKSQQELPKRVNAQVREYLECIDKEIDKSPGNNVTVSLHPLLKDSERKILNSLKRRGFEVLIQYTSFPICEYGADGEMRQVGSEVGTMLTIRW